MLKCTRWSNSFRIFSQHLILWFFMLSCQVMPSHTPEQLVFSMEKTACLGQCPVYSLKVYQDGWAELQGTANIQYLGKYHYKFSSREVDEIRAAFEQYDFFSLDEKYYANFSDLPTTYLFYQDGGKSKKVMDYYGAPENLKNLEEYLASFLAKDWKSSN